MSHARTISASRFDAGDGAHDRAKLEEARKAVNAAFEGFMQAGQEHYRLYFEDRLREIDGQLAVQ